ncbi:MAG: RNA polymerase sigma factor [Parvularculaceae bacterium]
MASGEESDDALVMRAGRGDRLAASRLIARHSPKIFAVCVKTLGERAGAEDASQETFLRVWKSAYRWKPGRATFETWLYRVAVNVCIDRLRARKDHAPAEEAAGLADEAPLADADLIAAERKRTLNAALGALPERQRLAIVLVHYQEMTNIEAAAVMEVSVDAFESLLSRARRSLKEILLPRRADLMEGA